MLELASRLSKGLPFARVDFFVVDGAIYFGEVTLYPESGSAMFSPLSYEEYLGSKVKIENL
jgi:hypothetical protein